MCLGVLPVALNGTATPARAATPVHIYVAGDSTATAGTGRI